MWDGLTESIYEFYVAYRSENEVRDMQLESAHKADSLLVTVLADGQPSLKTLYGRGKTEDEAYQKVNAYVSRTQYKDIKNNKLL